MMSVNRFCTSSFSPTVIFPLLNLSSLFAINLREVSLWECAFGAIPVALARVCALKSDETD